MNLALDLQTQNRSPDDPYAHKKLCARRLFIGDITVTKQTAPSTSTDQPTNQAALPTQTHSSQPDIPSTAEDLDNPQEQSTSTLPGRDSAPSADNQSPRISPQSTSEDSFVTATSSVQHETGEGGGSDEEIDVDLLMSHPLGIASASSFSSSSSSSTRTIRPTQNKIDESSGKLNHSTKVSVDRSVSPLKKKTSLAKVIRSNTLRWRKSGAVFVPIQGTTPPPIHGSEEMIKHDMVLYTRSLSSHGGNQPTRYKASREARLGLFKKSWTQTELVLTPTHLTVYTSSAIRWPRKRMEDRLFFNGPNRKPYLELFLLSPLDYTFCLRYPVDKVFATITFRARSLTLCWEWYLAIYRLLPESCKRPCPLWCEVYVPLMDIRVYLPLVNKKSEPQYGITTDHVKEAVLAMFEDADWIHIAESRLGKNNLDMCWVHKDRIELAFWQTGINGGKANLAICPQSIEQASCKTDTHQLEIRHTQHTPYDIRLKENKILREPLAVEGFLRKETDFQGNVIKSGRFIRKRFYFASFDQYLLYILPSKSTPIDAKYYIQEESQASPRISPHVATISPYTGDDATAQDELERRMSLLTNATGMIDLTEVSFVRRSFVSDGFDVNDSSSIQANSITPVLPSLTGPIRRLDKLRKANKSFLEMVMDNGLTIKFEANSSDTCNAWVDQLAKLVVYWKAHKEAQRDAHAQHNFANTLNENLHLATDRREEAVKTNGKKISADTRIWSRCVFEQCRDVVKTGTMYFQPKSRGTFTQKIFVLTANGWLLYFDTYQRSPVTCQPLLTAAHARKGLLDIANGYVYSGELSLPKQRPDRPPRMFKSGLTTTDDDEACIFSVWKPKVRRYFSTKRKRLSVYNHDYRSSHFKGETWVFLAENRQEMEEWVWAINMVIENLLRLKNEG